MSTTEGGVIFVIVDNLLVFDFGVGVLGADFAGCVKTRCISSWNACKEKPAGKSIWVCDWLGLFDWPYHWKWRVARRSNSVVRYDLVQLRFLFICLFIFIYLLVGCQKGCNKPQTVFASVLKKHTAIGFTLPHTLKFIISLNNTHLDDLLIVRIQNEMYVV